MQTYQRALVAIFLMDAKRLIAEGKVRFAPKEKNLACLLALGITHKDRLETLEALTPDDFCHMHDEDSAWVFARFISEKQIYIKLRVRQSTRSGDYLLCISFHEAEYELHYCFR